MRGIEEPPAAGIYSVAMVDIDGDGGGTTVVLTITNERDIQADVSLLPPGARKALVQWLGVGVADTL